MKRIAQTQDTNNDDSVEQSVMLSPRVLLTGPRQIKRLERQYRSSSEDLQNSLEDLNRTKDSYVSALKTFEQSEAYMRQLEPKVKMAMMLLNSARINPQYLSRAESAVQGIVGGINVENTEVVQKTGSTVVNMTRSAEVSEATRRAAELAFQQAMYIKTPEAYKAAAAADIAHAQALINAANAEKDIKKMQDFYKIAKTWRDRGEQMERLSRGESTQTTNTSSENTTDNTGNPTTTQTTAAATLSSDPQKSINVQQINELQAQLVTFVQEMRRRHGINKQRATSMEGQYNMSKSAYAKVRGQFFQIQTEISSLTSNLSGWNDRLGEYYAPNGGGEA
jgi:hypothetical protein